MKLHRTVEYKLHRTVEYKLHRTVEYKLHRTVEYKLHRTVEYKLHRTVEYKLHKRGVQATQTVEYKGSTRMCLCYIVDALKTHVFPLPLLCSPLRQSQEKQHT